jgi:hypothetical protein
MGVLGLECCAYGGLPLPSLVHVTPLEEFPASDELQEPPIPDEAGIPASGMEPGIAFDPPLPR